MKSTNSNDAERTFQQRIFPKLPLEIHIEQVGRKNEQALYFVFDPAKPSWVFVNEDGLQILRLCNGENSPEDISQGICKKGVELEYEVAMEIVSLFLQRMKENSIFEEVYCGKSNSNKFSGLAIEITNECNLRCIHCYLSAGRKRTGELTLNEIKNLLVSTKNVGGVSVALGGGEPLVRQDCIEIVEYAVSLGLLVSLGTNGTLINRELAKVLSGMPIKIQISLDGATQETHNRIRGQGTYDLVIRGIDNLVEANMAKDLVIAFTPMKPNFHEIPCIIDFALDRQIPVVQFPPLSCSGRAKTGWEALRLSNHEMLKFWEFVYNKSEELKGRVDLLADCFSIDINRRGIRERCSIGSQFRIDPEGHVYPCQCFHSGLDFCIGNVRKNDLAEMVNGSSLKRIKRICFQRPLEIDSCSKCKWVNLCGGGCMGNALETFGTIFHAESCEVRKEWIERLFEAKLNEVLSR